MMVEVTDDLIPAKVNNVKTLGMQGQDTRQLKNLKLAVDICKFQVILQGNMFAQVHMFL